MPRQYLAATLVVFFASLLTSGCKEPTNGRVAIRGVVTLEGDAIEYGSISLRPLNGGSGLSSGGKIVDGNFEIPAKTGPTIGQFSARVTIVGTDGKGNSRLGGNMKTLEVPIEIKADQPEYEIELFDKRGQ